MKLHDRDTQSSAPGFAYSAAHLLAVAWGPLRTGLVVLLAQAVLAHSDVAAAQIPADSVPEAQASPGLDRPQATGPPTSPVAIPPEALDQINALRAQMGGGVAGQLQGMFDNPESGKRELQRVFDESMQRLAEQASPPTGSPAPAPALASASAAGTARTAEVTALEAEPGELMGSKKSEVLNALRSAARDLDRVSADLEDVERYVQADRIRGTAMRLRQQAREIAGGGPTTGRRGRLEADRALQRHQEKSPSLPASLTDPTIRSGQ